MNAHTNILMSSLLSYPSLVDSVWGEEKQGGALDTTDKLFALDKEAWDLYEVCFDNFMQITEKTIDYTVGIDAIYYASVRLGRIRGEIYTISHMGDHAQVTEYRRTTTAEKYKERIDSRNHRANEIAEEAKNKSYYRSKRLKQAMDNLLYAIQPY